MRAFRTRRSGEEAGFTLVELLVSITILGVIMGSITSVVITTLGVESDQQEMQDVIDDGRLSMTRIRAELRSARRVIEGSDSANLHFWVDEDQDALVQPEELICYAVDELEGAGRWRIVRFTHAVDSCDADDVPAGQTAQTLASTLVDPEPFVAMEPPPGPITDPPTREVSILLDLEVQNARGPGAIQVEGSIRLRNVP